MFVRVVWQENRHTDFPQNFREPNGSNVRGINVFPNPGADMHRMTQGLFDR